MGWITCIFFFGTLSKWLCVMMTLIIQSNVMLNYVVPLKSRTSKNYADTIMLAFDLSVLDQFSAIDITVTVSLIPQSHMPITRNKLIKKKNPNKKCNT